ncbi:MAG: hypothetical protein LVQ95_03165 [Candidatus Micrarchaeales archaeon]|nr:hypothetical protein [Candidatus Micrarchaeales archaeon]
MAYLSIYKKSDFRQLTWGEYEKLLDSVVRQIRAYTKRKKIRIDAVVPIMRGGLFPGGYITFKLDMLRVLPVQYKYFFVGRDVVLKKIFGFPKAEIAKPNPVFLLVENNHCFGVTAATAAKDLKKMFPRCRIIYATDTMDYSYRNAVKDAEISFHGLYTNDTKTMNQQQCRASKVQNWTNLFPWESFGEEWQTVNAKQYKYSDLNAKFPHSKTMKKIRLW